MCLAQRLGLMMLLLVFLSCGSSAWAQGGNATLSGLITDSSGLTVAGAKVEAINAATNRWIRVAVIVVQQCSASTRPIAARNSGMPAPVSLEVSSTSGKAAGRRLISS